MRGHKLLAPQRVLLRRLLLCAVVFLAIKEKEKGKQKFKGKLSGRHQSRPLTQPEMIRLPGGARSARLALQQVTESPDAIPAARLSSGGPSGLISGSGGSSEGFLFSEDALPVGPIVRPAMGPVILQIGGSICTVVGVQLLPVGFFVFPRPNCRLPFVLMIIGPLSGPLPLHFFGGAGFSFCGQPFTVAGVPVPIIGSPFLQIGRPTGPSLRIKLVPVLFDPRPLLRLDSLFVLLIVFPGVCGLLLLVC